MNIKILNCLLLLFLLLTTCDSDLDTLTLGSDLVKPDNKLIVIDTFSIEMYTVIMDSIQTSGKELLLTGMYNDEKTGKIVSKSYFQTGLQDYSIDDEEYYDSISLIIIRSGYSYGDTTLRQRLTVHKLSDDLKLSDQDYFYNTSSIDYEQNAIGEILFYPRPQSGQELAISLDKSFGQELFDYIIKVQKDELTEDQFADLFKGFALIPDEAIGNSIIGYTATDTSLYLKIYTHTIEAERISHEILLPMINTDLQFNQITCDWNNNVIFKNHRQKYAIPASETDNITFVHAGLGMFTRMIFPTLPSILEFENSLPIRAMLYFKPAYGSHKSLPAAGNLSIYETGKNNTLDALLTYSDGTSISANLNVDELYDEETWYSFDITDYLIEDISDYYLDPGKALSISFSYSNISNSLDQLLLGASFNKLTKPKLEILFLFYDQQ